MLLASLTEHEAASSALREEHYLALPLMKQGKARLVNSMGIQGSSAPLGKAYEPLAALQYNSPREPSPTRLKTIRRGVGIGWLKSKKPKARN